MFESVIDWIIKTSQVHEIHPEHVLEVGSLDRKYKIGARSCFPDADYVGIDIKKGPNVDIQMSVLDLRKNYYIQEFDAILCLHLLEHMAKPWKAMEQINLMLKPAGHLFLSMPTFGFPRHDFPKDYWRASEEAITDVLMDEYWILELEHDKSKFGKHPFINCLGVKKWT